MSEQPNGLAGGLGEGDGLAGQERQVSRGNASGQRYGGIIRHTLRVRRTYANFLSPWSLDTFTFVAVRPLGGGVLSDSSAANDEIVSRV